MDTPATIGPISLPASVLAAIIAAIASIIVAVISLVSTLRNTRKTNQLAKELEAYKHTLDEEQAEKNASISNMSRCSFNLLNAVKVRRNAFIALREQRDWETWDRGDGFPNGTIIIYIQPSTFYCHHL